MLIPNHLVIPGSLAVTSLEFIGERVVIHARVTSTAACCPTCQTPSHRVHSHYTRTLADLLWAGLPVSFQVVARRFHCPEPECPQLIYAERLVGRQGLAWSGSWHGVGADTLLRVIRRAP